MQQISHSCGCFYLTSDIWPQYQIRSDHKISSYILDILLDFSWIYSWIFLGYILGYILEYILGYILGYTAWFQDALQQRPLLWHGHAWLSAMMHILFGFNPVCHRFFSVMCHPMSFMMCHNNLLWCITIPYHPLLCAMYQCFCAFPCTLYLIWRV